MLYVFDDIDALDDDFLQICMSYLSVQRREKVLSYRCPQDRKLSAAAYLLLRLALVENYGIDEPVLFEFAKNGKPLLCGYPGIHFNISHCKSAVACAVSNDETGVDVQETVPVSDDLANRVLTKKEYAAYRTAGDPFRKFCEYWTIKESWLKKTGLGIGADLTALSAEDIGEKTLFSNVKDYCCCVTGTSVQLKRVNIRERMYLLKHEE